MLLVDIGNARIKWALQDADYWKTGEPLQRQNRAFKDIARPAWKDLDTPGRVIVSNVAGEDLQKVRADLDKTALESLHGIPARCRAAVWRQQCLYSAAASGR